jgi:hypothetical protein
MKIINVILYTAVLIFAMDVVTERVYKTYYYITDSQTFIKYEKSKEWYKEHGQNSDIMNKWYENEAKHGR